MKHQPPGSEAASDDFEQDHDIVCRLDELLAARQLTLAELARRVDMSVVNLSILKNNRGRAIRFTTLSALCRELQCTPGDLFVQRAQNTLPQE